MKRAIPFIFLLVLVPTLVRASGHNDMLGRMAEHSEIKAIAVIKRVQNLTCYSDGSFKHVHFKRIYAITPDTPKSFVGGCRDLDQRWQRRSKEFIYFRPIPGQKVYVTVSYNGGAITSFTPLTPDLEKAVRNDPYSLYYEDGKARINPGE
ncbi:hypothetical protein [Pseudodesulfovibrio tunisiensis]|uniref:hypothetical protein n=1 Tax=Pseudodesulfovibrio tunisiensis TaxID=463192 RepID=UPI001FB467C2|nr:hypothetical protein [Pseudodesulfovibrio tunisiensis]